MITAPEASEDGRGLVLGLWNSSAVAREGEVRLWKPIARVARCRLDESEDEALEPSDSHTVRVAGRSR